MSLHAVQHPEREALKLAVFLCHSTARLAFETREKGRLFNCLGGGGGGGGGGGAGGSI